MQLVVSSWWFWKGDFNLLGSNFLPLGALYYEPEKSLAIGEKSRK